MWPSRETGLEWASHWSTPAPAPRSARSWSGPDKEIFALQDDLAKEVAVFLRQRLGQEVELRKSRQRTNNPAAWGVVAEGGAGNKGRGSAGYRRGCSGSHKTVPPRGSLLAKAETADPKWVTPVTQRGWLSYRQARLSGSFDKTYYGDRITKGLGHVDQALKLQPGDPDALEFVAPCSIWRWLLNLAPDPAEAERLMVDAEKDLRASVAANPEQASAWNTLSHLLINKLETAEAKLAALRAYDADPYLTSANLTIWRLFSTSLDLEDGVEANHWCSEGGRRFPADPRFAECRVWVGFLEGQRANVDSAWSEMRRYVELSSPNQREFWQLRGQMIVAAVLARAGLKDSARAVILRSRGDARIDPTRELAQWEAVARTILGDKDEAITQLGVWLATNPQQRATMVKDNLWWWKDLRGEKRYRQLIGLSN